MPEIRIYVEGGGDAKQQKQQIRQGFNEFFKEAREQGRTNRVRWQVVACGSRNDAFDDFRSALRDHPDAFNILLVDSEEPIADGIGPWAHLSGRDPSWRDDDPRVPDEHYHLMTQVMEAWLVADLDTVEAYYGQRFNRNAIPANRDVEAIPKDTLLDALTEATRRTQKGSYKKIKHAADLLKLIRPGEVRRASYCDRLFQQIERVMGIV
jgi:hypothetical protein